MDGRGQDRSSRQGVPCRDHTGREFPSRSAMARAYGLSEATLSGRLRRGLPLEQALTMPAMRGPEVPCTDHIGNEFRSQAEMLKYWGINQTAWKYRHIVRGWDIRDTLETPIGDSDLAGAHACRDHQGRTFPSIKAMCDHWRVPRNVFFTRRKQGKTLEQCLDPVTRPRQGQANTIKDHLGGAYTNLDAMCAAWDISKAQYMQNIRNGLDIGRALTERTARPRHPKDHLGNEYRSINAMCRAWNITKTTLRARLELGWTLKEILEKPGNESHYIRTVDHLGNEYRCQRDMLKAWNVTYATYKHRLKNGATLEEALCPYDRHQVRCTDHLGNAFPCLLAMLEYWHVHPGCYHTRTKKHHMDLKASLETRYPKDDPDAPVNVKSRHGAWFLCVYKKRGYMVDASGVQDLMCRASLDGYMADPDAAMSCSEIKPGWYQLEGGPAGPGVVMNARNAWRLAVMARYAPKPKVSLMTPAERREYEEK